MSKRTFCVVTGSRAEYGLLYWILKEIQSDPDLTLKLVATGSHLSEVYGSTYRFIEQDGFRIDAKVDLEQESDSPQAITQAIGRGLIRFADYFAKARPDVVIVLGDRFELMSIATAAMMARIPIAHISGGEVTEGAIDDSIRHAVTKMASYHFVAADPYRERVIRMGESPDRVLNLGDPGLDNVARLKLLTRDELEQQIGLKLSYPTFLITYHPVTLSDEAPDAGVRALLAALEQFSDATMIFTRPNADAGGRVIAEAIDEFTARQASNCMVSSSLGQVRYLSAMKHCDAIIGNSSSGIVEAPALEKATVNIGERQTGRLFASSIVSCPEQTDAIVAAIQKVLSPAFRDQLPSTRSLYGAANSSKLIVEFLKTADLKTAKKFFDLPVQMPLPSRIGGEFEISRQILLSDRLFPLLTTPLAHSLWVDILRLGGKRIAYVPAFCCSSVLQPFRELNFTIRHYTMGDDLRSPQELEGDLAGCTVLFIHYFGTLNRMMLEQLRRRRKTSDFFIIEDCVQAALTAGIGTIGDYLVTSYRKFAPQTDGALLGSRLPIESELEAASEEMTSQRFVGKIIKSEGATDSAYLALFEEAERGLDHSHVSRRISWASEYIMQRTDFPGVSSRRVENWKLLSDRLSDKAFENILYSLMKLSEGEVPLGFPIVVKKGLRNAMRSYLAEDRIYCPVHWPMDTKDLTPACDADLELSRNILTIPIDQRLDENAVSRVADRIAQFANRSREA
jgi:UDP-N-acetylglucosamine 2-epimerase (non-hydrolysing)/GDP/UDP-N,N'-diacetylbacillosamine 2-epimerase (hydrolysing)